MRASVSSTSSASARICSNRSPVSSLNVGSLCLRTQSSASSPVMSSSHRYGSSSTNPFLPYGSVARRAASHQGADDEHQHGRRHQRAHPLDGRAPCVVDQIERLSLLRRRSRRHFGGFRAGGDGG